MRPADDVLRDLVRDFVRARRSARDAEIDQALREAEWNRERAHLLRRIDADAA